MQSHQTIELLDEALQKQLEQTPANDYLRIQDLYRECLDNEAKKIARSALKNLTRLLGGEEDMEAYIRISVAKSHLERAEKFATSKAGAEEVLKLGLARLVPVDWDEPLGTATSSATGEEAQS